MSEQLMSKAEVLDAMKRGHNDFVMIVFDLDEAKMTVAGPYPDSDWTLKDTLAHLTACTQDMISHLPGHQPIPFPVEAEEGESWDNHVERMNEYYYQRDKDKPMVEVGAEFDSTYRQAVRAVEALSEEQVADRAVQELIAGDTYEHYAEHLGYIADWLAQQDATPLRNKAELLAAMQQGHDKLLAALGGLSDEQMITPGPDPDSAWTVKDTLAHLAAWMRAMVKRLPGGAGKPFPFEEQPDEDRDNFIERVNEYWYQRDKGKPLAEVRDEFEQAYRQMADATANLSDAQVGERAIQYRIEGNTFGHFEEHLGFISDWLKQQEQPHISKADMLARMAAGHDELLAALGSLSDAQMTSPGPYRDSDWTVKDTLAHCTAWMRATPPRLPGGNGNLFPFAQLPDEDDRHYDDRINAYWRERDKDKPLAEVRSEFEAAFQQLLAVVERLSDEEIAIPEVQDRIGNNSYWHFEGHLGYIGDWLKQQEQPHISKAEMLARMAAGRDELLAAISNLSEAQISTPGLYPDSAWTVKDTLAHLAAWMRANAMLLRDGASKPYPFEEQPDESEDHFVERVNDYWYQRDKDKPLAEVRSEFEAAYQQQFAVMEALSDEQAVEPTHIKEHLGFISDWLKQQQEQA